MRVARRQGSSCEQFANLRVQILPTMPIRDVLGDRESFLSEGFAFEDARQLFIEFLGHEPGRVMNRGAKEEGEATVFDQSNHAVEMRVGCERRLDGRRNG